MTDLARHLASLSPEKRAFLMEQLNLSAKRGHIANEQIIPQSGHIFPLSFAQRRLWFMHQLLPGDVSYNVPAALHLIGHLHTQALEQALNEIIRRHEVLRTTFIEVGGEPRQVIASSFKLTLPIADLRELPESERTPEGQRYAQETLQTPFDLVRGPLIRGAIIRLEELESYFVLSMHHIIYDAWSGSKFFRELTAFYEAYCRGKTLLLPPLPLQYKDFSHWQYKQTRSRLTKGHLAYWKEQLKGKREALNLPVKQSRASTALRPTVVYHRVFPRALVTDLKELSHRENVTLFMLLLAAFQILLHRYTGQVDIAVGVPVANRPRSELEDLIGFFANILVLRINVAGDPHFYKLLKQVQQVCLEAYAHQDFPFEQLVEALNPDRILDQTPLFQYMFSFNTVMQLEMKLGDLVIEPLNLYPGMGKHDLFLAIEESLEKLQVKVEYNTDLFDAATIDRLLGHYQTLLEGIVAHPEQRLSALPLLSSAEMAQVLVSWNATQITYPQNLCLHQLFEAQVERSPEAIAVTCEEQHLTYTQLNSYANQLAALLQREGIGLEIPVGVYMQRGIELVIAILAILKAGGTCVPLDHSYPRQRLIHMLRDTQLKVVLTNSSLLGSFPNSDETVLLCLNTQWQVLQSESSANIPMRSQPGNCAYVLYTSGSTGEPKGVAIPHQGLVNLIYWRCAHSIMGLGSRTMQFALISLDVSCQELFATWSTGGCLVLIDQQQHQDPYLLLQCVREQGIERLFLPFIALHQLAQIAIQCLEPAAGSLREVITTGEPLRASSSLVEFFKNLEGCRLENQYGSIETHTVTAFALAEDPNYWPLLSPIGKPLSNEEVYVLDKDLQPVPVGVRGELYLGGVGLARGYWGKADLTADRFLPHPFSRVEGARLYRTGDLVRYRVDGHLEYLGRVENQVKFRGYRIELEEIEMTLKQHPSIQEAVVLIRKDTRGDNVLVTYIVPNDTSTPLEGWRSYLSQKLPAYMIPSEFLALEHIPLTIDGKVDRKALPEPPGGRFGSNTGYVAPRTLIEAQIARIWEEVLMVEQVGIDDDFFVLGGHSLKAVQVIARIREQLMIQFPLRDLFAHPTVRMLAHHVD